MIKIKTIAVSDMDANCYIVTDIATGDTAVIDPGEFDARLDKVLSQIGFEHIKLILLTHGHFDHIVGTNEIVRKTGGLAKVAVSEREKSFLENSSLNLSMQFYGVPIDSIKADILFNDGEEIKLGESTIKVIATPGHTVGSVCFVCEKNIFSGDTLFYGSYGRIDFPTGSMKDMIASLQRLAELEGDYKVYPGHNTTTTLDFERKYNPIIGRNYDEDLY